MNDLKKASQAYLMKKGGVLKIDAYAAAEHKIVLFWGFLLWKFFHLNCTIVLRYMENFIIKRCTNLFSLKTVGLFFLLVIQ